MKVVVISLINVHALHKISIKLNCLSNTQQQSFCAKKVQMIFWGQFQYFCQDRAPIQYNNLC